MHILCRNLNFFEDDHAQGSAEYLMIFGGIIIIAIVAIIFYQSYIQSVSPFYASSDINKVRGSIR
jgi:uncharacterized protein (UPF0333 family)